MYPPDPPLGYHFGPCPAVVPTVVRERAVGVVETALSYHFGLRLRREPVVGVVDAALPYHVGAAVGGLADGDA
jgi:hypothetical protein